MKIDIAVNTDLFDTQTNSTILSVETFNRYHISQLHFIQAKSIIEEKYSIYPYRVEKIERFAINTESDIKNISEIMSKEKSGYIVNNHEQFYNFVYRDETEIIYVVRHVCTKTMTILNKIKK